MILRITLSRNVNWLVINLNFVMLLVLDSIFKLLWSRKNGISRGVNLDLFWGSEISSGCKSHIFTHMGPWDPKGRKKKPKTDSGVGFLGRSQLAPTHQLVSLGSTVSSPSGSWAEPCCKWILDIEESRKRLKSWVGKDTCALVLFIWGGGRSPFLRGTKLGENNLSVMHKHIMKFGNGQNVKFIRRICYIASVGNCMASDVRLCSAIEWREDTCKLSTCPSAPV